jgi:hypothetical protein
LFFGGNRGIVTAGIKRIAGAAAKAGYGLQAAGYGRRDSRRLVPVAWRLKSVARSLAGEKKGTSHMELESRIEHLERQVRWLKAAVLAVALIAVAIGQFRNAKELVDLQSEVADHLRRFQDAQNREVKSERFILVNEQGDPRGVWAAEGGQSALKLLDADRKPLVVVAVANESRGLEISDSDGRSRVSLTADGHAGSLLIRAPEPESQATALINVGVTGPRLSMHDNTGNLQHVAPW